MDILKKIVKNSHLMVIICVVLMFISMCLPLASAQGEYRELLNEGFSMSKLSADQIKGVSLLEHVIFYVSCGVDYTGTERYAGAYMAMGVFTLFFYGFVLLFALLKKAIPVIIFDLLTSGMMLLTTVLTIFMVRAGTYGVGFGIILYVIASIAAAVFAVRLFMDKRRARYAKKMEQTQG